MMQGQSSATLDKERHLASALSISMRILSGKFAGRGYRYWHFDANAGCGWNDEVDVIGSPIVFHRVADQYLIGMDREAFFCDLNSNAIKQLELRLQNESRESQRSFLFPYDNEEVLEVFAEYIRKSGERKEYATGSVIVDPNGYWYRDKNGQGAPIKALTEFTKEFPRIDVILNLNTRAYKLQRSHEHNVMRPADVLASLNKSDWLVKRTHTGHNEYLLAVGRNFPTGSHLQFCKLSSDGGRHIMTMIEGDRQGKLPLCGGDDAALF